MVRGAQATLERGPGHTEHGRQRRRDRRECTRHSTGTASTATGTLTGKRRDRVGGIIGAYAFPVLLSALGSEADRGPHQGAGQPGKPGPGVQAK
ncbi:MAG: hypothetical protein ABSB59_39070 [Streptosporangiaceae bacterium]